MSEKSKEQKEIVLTISLPTGTFNVVSATHNVVDEKGKVLYKK